MRVAGGYGDESARWGVRLPGLVVAPADGLSTELDPACVPASGGDRCEDAGWGVRLPLIVAAPTDGFSAGADSACVQLARGDGGEPAGRGVRLSKPVAAPAVGRAVRVEPAGVASAEGEGGEPGAGRVHRPVCAAAPPAGGLIGVNLAGRFPSGRRPDGRRRRLGFRRQEHRRGGGRQHHENSAGPEGRDARAPALSPASRAVACRLPAALGGAIRRLCSAVRRSRRPSHFPFEAFPFGRPRQAIGSRRFRAARTLVRRPCRSGRGAPGNGGAASPLTWENTAGRPGRRPAGDPGGGAGDKSRRVVPSRPWR